MTKAKKQYKMVRVLDADHEVIKAVADATQSGITDVVSKMVASIPANGIEINHKIVFCVRHADGRMEIADGSFDDRAHEYITEGMREMSDAEKESLE